MTEINSDLIEFDEEQHKYTYDGENMTSVTQWVSSFFSKFDAERISPFTAKAVNKEIKAYSSGELSPEDMTKAQRLFRSDFESEVESRKNKQNPITPRRVQLFWERWRDEAAEHGTLVHEELEECLQGVLDPLLDEVHQKTINGMAAYAVIRNNNGYPSQVKTEEIVVAPELGLAGTIDVQLLEGNKVVLVDWKTNAELKREGYRGQTAQPPVNHLQHCSFNKYRLQLSTYAYMLENYYGMEIKRMYIVHLPDNHNHEVIPVEYLKEEVEAMIASGVGR